MRPGRLDVYGVRPTPVPPCERPAPEVTLEPGAPRESPATQVGASRRLLRMEIAVAEDVDRDRAVSRILHGRSPLQLEAGRVLWLCLIPR